MTNFDQLANVDQIRIDLMKKLDNHEIYHEKSMLRQTIYTSGLLAKDEDSEPLFKIKGKTVRFDEYSGLYV